MKFGAGVTAVVLRDPPPLPHGVPAGPPQETEVPGCGLGDLDSTEDDSRGTSAVVRRTLYAPFGADVRRTDRVRVDGHEWEVDGKPVPRRSPFSGWGAGLVVQLLRQEG